MTGQFQHPRVDKVWRERTVGFSSQVWGRLDQMHISACIGQIQRGLEPGWTAADYDSAFSHEILPPHCSKKQILSQNGNYIRF
jgi:hypothetical protein